MSSPIIDNAPIIYTAPAHIIAPDFVPYHLTQCKMTVVPPSYSNLTEIITKYNVDPEKFVCLESRLSGISQ